MPDPAGGDFLQTGRFGFNNQAATRRELVNGGDLLKDRSVPPKKLSRDAFPPDIKPGPTDGAPTWHDEPDKGAHEKGVPRSVDDPSRLERFARADHNHDFTFAALAMTQVSATAPTDYTSPFYDAGQGPHPAATPDEPHKRIANWSVYADYADRIRGGPIEVWTETSLDSGATYGEPVLRAVVPPGSISAEYEDRDVDWDPNTYVVEPVVRVTVKPRNHDKSPALKVVRAGVDGKIDEDWLPTPTIPVVPTGTVLMFAGQAAPAGTLYCDGTSYLRADYAALFAVIGTIYGSVDGTHFNVPDLQATFPRGASTMTVLGGTGGAATHDHGGSTGTSSAAGTADTPGAAAVDAAHSHTITATDNQPPYVDMGFVIKT